LEVTLDKFKLAIGIPLSWPYCPSDFFFSYAMMKKPAGNQLIKASSGPIDVMRNMIARKAFELKCTHLLFLDADMVYPEDTIPKLLSHNKDIVGGLCFKKGPPFDPTIMIGEPYRTKILTDYPENELVEVTATGTACLLINMRVFEDVDYPWFQFTKSEEGRPVGEDVGFCYRAKAAGYSVYVDTSVKTEHISFVRVGEDLHKFHAWTMKNKGCNIENSY
jgi:GT2 family glycosyltransferase